MQICSCLIIKITTKQFFSLNLRHLLPLCFLKTSEASRHLIKGFFGNQDSSIDIANTIPGASAKIQEDRIEVSGRVVQEVSRENTKRVSDFSAFFNLLFSVYSWVESICKIQITGALLVEVNIMGLC